MSATPRPQSASSDVQTWRDGLSWLEPNVLSCLGMTAVARAAMHEAGLDALDRHGAALIEHGWTTPELFGVHPQLRTGRVDFCRAFVLGGRKAETVLATGSASGW